MTPVDDVTIVVEDGRIVDAGPAVDRPLEGATVDMGEATIIPGFIDAHVHIGLASRQSMFCPRCDDGAGSRLAPQARSGPWSSARDATISRAPIVAAGQMLTAPRGYPTQAGWAPTRTGLPVSTARRGARRRSIAAARSGASVIKVALNPLAGPRSRTPRPSRRSCGAAHDRSLRVTGHVHGLDELIKALDAHVDELAHMLMSRRRRSRTHHLSAWSASHDRRADPVGALRLEPRDRGRESALRSSRWVDAVIYGTDLGNEGPRPGIDQLRGRTP